MKKRVWFAILLSILLISGCALPAGPTADVYYPAATTQPVKAGDTTGGPIIIFMDGFIRLWPFSEIRLLNWRCIHVTVIQGEGRDDD